MSELDPFSDQPSGNDYKVRNTIVGGALATLVILGAAGVLLKDRIGSLFSGSKIPDVTPIPDPTNTPEARALMKMVKTPAPDIANQVSEGLSLPTLPATTEATATLPVTATPAPRDTETATPAPTATETVTTAPTATETLVPEDIDWTKGIPEGSFVECVDEFNCAMGITKFDEDGNYYFETEEGRKVILDKQNVYNGRYVEVDGKVYEIISMGQTFFAETDLDGTTPIGRATIMLGGQPLIIQIESSHPSYAVEAGKDIVLVEKGQIYTDAQNLGIMFEYLGEGKFRVLRNNGEPLETYDPNVQNQIVLPLEDYLYEVKFISESISGDESVRMFLTLK